MTDVPMFSVPVQGTESDERYTPPWLFDELGDFDLDPCSPEGGPLHGRAASWFTRADDGLAQPWHGRVFMNPPYSNATAWVDKFIDHGDGIALLPLASSAWRHRLNIASDVIWMPEAGFKFVGVTHAQIHISYGIFFAAIGIRNSLALRHLHASGRHPGVLMEPVA